MAVSDQGILQAGSAAMELTNKAADEANRMSSEGCLLGGSDDTSTTAVCSMRPMEIATMEEDLDDLHSFQLAQLETFDRTFDRSRPDDMFSGYQTCTISKWCVPIQAN